VGKVLVTGSVAYDTIMVFNGRFSDHILPDQIHKLSVSFIVDDLYRRRGGTAANIAYNLALLGEHPAVAAGVGNDFGPELEVMKKSGIDFSPSLICDDIPSPNAHVVTDIDANQIIPFFLGAMGRSDQIDISSVNDVEHLIVSPDSPAGMTRHLQAVKKMGAKLVYSPGQTLPALDDAILQYGIEESWMLICNDYEMELIAERLGKDQHSFGRERVVVVTKGASGADFFTPNGDFHVNAAPVAKVVDPTGAGDAFIAGLVAGIRQGKSLADAAHVAAVAAAFVVEQSGTQEHSYTSDEFQARLASSLVATG
jgi:adenosine kinase